jgi:hypothetical protein
MEYDAAAEEALQARELGEGRGPGNPKTLNPEP